MPPSQEQDKLFLDSGLSLDRKGRWARAAIAPFLAALAFSSLAKADGITSPEKTIPMVGVVENQVLAPNLALAKKRMDLIKSVGANTVRVNITWGHGVPYPDEKGLLKLQNATEAANLAGLRMFVSFYPQPGELTNDGKATPLSASQQRQFCDFVDRYYRSSPTLEDVEIGNEPNSNLFWQPQYGPDGKSRAPESFVSLLSRCYDTLKKTAQDLNRKVTIYGPGLASKGNGDPYHGKPSHPPKDFLIKMGQAMQATGRTRPILDVLTIHPYEESNASSPVRLSRANSSTVGLADFKILRQTLEDAFSGTAQPWKELPVLYDEFGVQTSVPEDKMKYYRKTENVNVVDARTQGLYLQQALEMAACQPNVEGVFTFLSTDEPDLTRWQSGLYYNDGAPKASVSSFKATIKEVQSNDVDCSKY